MTSVRGRGRGGNVNVNGSSNANGNGNANGGGGGGGGAGRGAGPDAANNRRGSWRGGPPGSNGSISYGNAVRGGNTTPAGNTTPVGGRTSINDHMSVMGKVVDEKPRTPKGFATDPDISGTSNQAAPQERELKPWVADDLPKAASGPRQSNGGPKDKETFGGEAKVPWDQFETNARLFGTKTSYQEEIYTTKLNKGGPDFEKRKKEADRLASEIMNTNSNNSHIAEERNLLPVEDWSKDEEEKFSGVVRNPNAYVPPAARRGGGSVTLPRPANTTPTTTTNGLPKLNGTSALPQKPVAAPPPVPSPRPDTLAPIDPISSSDAAPPSAPLIRKPSDSAGLPTAALNVTVPAVNGPSTTGATDEKEGQPMSSVVDSFRQFVGTERERVEAKKSSMVKLERDRQVAEFKKFQTSFKVPLPMPKDILPLLSKDEEKQKAISAQAATNLQAAKSKPVQTASPVPQTPSTPSQPRKIAMKIPEIPPFSAAKRKALPVPVPEGAKKDIDLGVPPSPSPAPSNGSLTAEKEKEKEDAEKAKLNPNASSFVFKPNPGAAAFKPGQSSTSSPAPAPAQVQPTAGPSVPKNPFFRDQPPTMAKDFNPRDSFNLWKHGQVPAAASISPQWPYTGRKFNVAIHGPMMHQMGMGFDDDPTSPHAGPPPTMQGMPPNFAPYYRYQPGMPQQQMPGQMQGNPMFSPGMQYAPLPGQPPQHLGGQQQPNGMPMYFQNGMPQNPQFLPPQHLHFNPNTPQRLGPGQNGPGSGQGPGGPGPGPGMYYQHQMQQVSTPQQTPQMHHNQLGPPPSQQPPFQNPSMQSPIPSQGFEGQNGGGGGPH